MAPLPCTPLTTTENMLVIKEPKMERTVELKSAFKYEPLDAGSTQIRLIQLSASENDVIHLRMQHHPLQDSSRQLPSYKTLSYMWGTDSASKLIKINGENFYVRRNLFDFLRHIRQPESRAWFGADDFLWVDSICINQDDLEERSSQVRLMGQIYTSSINTIAWLRGQYGTNRYLARESGMSDISPGDPYWSRLWPCQEIILAKGLTLIVKERLHSHDHFVDKTKQTDNRIRNLFLWRLFNGGQTAKPYLCQALETFGNRKCSDVKDRLFAILSLIARGAEFFVNYKDDVDTILWRALDHFNGSYSDKSDDDAVRAGIALCGVFGIKTAPRLPTLPEDCLLPVRINRLEKDPSKFFENCRHTRLCFCPACAVMQPLIPLIEGQSSPGSNYLMCTTPAIRNAVVIFERGDLDTARLVAVGFIQYANHAGKHRVTIVTTDPDQRPFDTVATIATVSSPLEGEPARYERLTECGACVINVQPPMLQMLLGAANGTSYGPRHVGESWREYTRNSRLSRSLEWRTLDRALDK